MGIGTTFCDESASFWSRYIEVLFNGYGADMTISILGLAGIRSGLAASALAVLSMATTTAMAASGGTVTGDTIVIGQTAAQSGPQAPIGTAKWGLQAFVAATNANGGVNGKKLKLISYDDSYQPSQTTALTKKLVYNDDVFAIVGSIGSPTVAAIYKTLNEAKIPLVSMGSGSPIFYQSGLKYVFPSWPIYTTDGKTMGAFVKKHFAGQSTAVIYQNDSFGKPILQGIKDILGKVDVEVPYVPTQVDFSSVVIKLKSEGIKVVMLATIATSGARILNQMASLKYKPTRILTASGCGYEGIFKTIASLNGTFCTAFLPPPGSNSPQWAKLTSAMAKYTPGHAPNIYAAWGWLAGQVTYAGLHKIKGPITREAFVQQLETLRDYDTIGGKISYSSDSHDGGCCELLWQAVDGRWKLVPDSTYNGIAKK
jgi:ABC-type branched-subunit amino acid transport system substrate-binding protein